MRAARVLWGGTTGTIRLSTRRRTGMGTPAHSRPVLGGGEQGRQLPRTPQTRITWNGGRPVLGPTGQGSRWRCVRDLDDRRRSQNTWETRPRRSRILLTLETAVRLWETVQVLRLTAYYMQQRVLCVTRTRVLKAVDDDDEVEDNGGCVHHNKK